DRVVVGASFLGGTHVLATWTFRSLSTLERDRLTFAQPRKRHAVQCRLMEEILLPVFSGNEPEALVADESLDCAFHSGHVLSLCRSMPARNPRLAVRRSPIRAVHRSACTQNN